MEDAEISPEKESTRVHQRNVWIGALVSGTLCVVGGFANHSWLHFWMTYRELSLFIFAFVSLFIVILEDKETHGARGM